MESRKQRRETPSKKRQGRGMRDGPQRGTNEIFIVGVAHAATVMGVVSVPAPTINSDALKTVHHALVIQTVKQTV
jgi:hypothetical protein